MGLGSYLDRKIKEHKENNFRQKAIDKKAEVARWQARERGTIARAKTEGYKQGKTGGGGMLNAFAGIGNAPIFQDNPFSIGPSPRRSTTHRSSHKQKVVYVEVQRKPKTVHNRHRSHRERNDNPFL